MFLGCYEPWMLRFWMLRILDVTVLDALIVSRIFSAAQKYTFIKYNYGLKIIFIT